jgi:hypothetical protein
MISHPTPALIVSIVLGCFYFPIANSGANSWAFAKISAIVEGVYAVVSVVASHLTVTTVARDLVGITRHRTHCRAGVFAVVVEGVHGSAMASQPAAILVNSVVANCFCVPIANDWTNSRASHVSIHVRSHLPHAVVSIIAPIVIVAMTTQNLCTFVTRGIAYIRTVWINRLHVKILIYNWFAIL